MNPLIPSFLSKFPCETHFFQIFPNLSIFVLAAQKQNITRFFIVILYPKPPQVCLLEQRTSTPLRSTRSRPTHCPEWSEPALFLRSR